jgi:PKD repeat protein
VKSWNVILQVIDDKEASNSVTIATATTNNALPVAKFNTPTVNGYIVSVVSTSTDSDGTITSTKWNWGDGTNNDTTASASHNYATPGTYTITLSVVDNFTATSLPKTVEVTVPSSPPVASFSSTVNRLNVAFDASASTSAFGGAITSYLWDFGDT